MLGRDVWETTQVHGFKRTNTLFFGPKSTWFLILSRCHDGNRDKGLLFCLRVPSVTWTVSSVSVTLSRSRVVRPTETSKTRRGTETLRKSFRYLLLVVVRKVLLSSFTSDVSDVTPCHREQIRQRPSLQVHFGGTVKPSGPCYGIRRRNLWPLYTRENWIFLPSKCTRSDYEIGENGLWKSIRKWTCTHHEQPGKSLQCIDPNYGSLY